MIKLSQIPYKRVISIIILFLILTGLCIYYHDNIWEKQLYPSTGVVVKYYPQGEMVAVSGTVTEIFNNGYYMEDNYENHVIKFKVYTTQKVKEGDKTQVLGVLGPDYQLTPSKIIVTEEWSYQFLLLRSFIALLFLVFIFNRYWRFDFANYEFIRRK
ncbi:MAG: hypothetical protein LLF83_03920 [Methanobacterium sp.]|nr:hypothetical protein [Methanobacterium sp.]